MKWFQVSSWLSQLAAPFARKSAPSVAPEPPVTSLPDEKPTPLPAPVPSKPLQGRLFTSAYPDELRERVYDLWAAGVPSAQIAAEVGLKSLKNVNDIVRAKRLRDNDPRCASRERNPLHPAAAWPPERVEALRQHIAANRSARQIALAMGLTKSQVAKQITRLRARGALPPAQPAPPKLTECADKPPAEPVQRLPEPVATEILANTGRPLAVPPRPFKPPTGRPPEDTTEILRMLDEGKSREEIAAALGISRNAVNNRILRLRAKEETQRAQESAQQDASLREAFREIGPEHAASIEDALYGVLGAAGKAAMQVPEQGPPVGTHVNGDELHPNVVEGLAGLRVRPLTEAEKQEIAHNESLPPGHADRVLHPLVPAPVEPMPATGPYLITQLGPGQCRWPVEEHPGEEHKHRFCGEPTVGRQPYCPSHVVLNTSSYQMASLMNSAGRMRTR